MQATSFHKGMHVNREDVYEVLDRCPVCLSREKRNACLRIQDDPIIEMLFCKECEACSASHMPKQELLDRYYARYYSKTSDHVAFSNPDRLARHLSTVLKPRATGALRVLDFGGGDASLAIALAQKFQVSAGFEIPIAIDVVDYEKARQAKVPNITVNGFRDLNEVGGPYDVLLASAILEHIPDAHATIRKLIGMAGPGAFMYARTPYVIPLARFVPMLDTTFPGHVHDMGSGFWNRFAETFNLRARLLLSRPSLVETTLRSHPIRTILAQALKFPALAELWLSKQMRVPRWNLVGGWEVVLHYL
jgi:2-polyprenyl-3-methyl-5-hydroxy-6-metoxy-1,4-benzoquinol methylase